MKKRTINAFTLVEMLIVIVIIGILIAALMPRMQAAQGRARDVSRKTALSQVQSAIVTSQGDRGIWPGQCEGDDTRNTDCAEDGITLSKVATGLKTAGMNSIPEDPLKTDEVPGLGNLTNTSGDYAYMVTRRNGTDNGGFVLMAKTEVEGGSNWVVCPQTCVGATATDDGCIHKERDITDIHPCTKFEKFNDDSTCKIETDGTCKYYADGQLRYIVLY